MHCDGFVKKNVFRVDSDVMLEAEAVNYELI